MQRAYHKRPSWAAAGNDAEAAGKAMHAEPCWRMMRGSLRCPSVAGRGGRAGTGEGRGAGEVAHNIRIFAGKRSRGTVGLTTYGVAPTPIRATMSQGGRGLWVAPSRVGRKGARARAQRVEFSRPASTSLSHGRCNAPLGTGAATKFTHSNSRAGKCTCVEHPSLVRDRRESRGHSGGSADFTGAMSGAIASPGRLWPVGVSSVH